MDKSNDKPIVDRLIDVAGEIFAAKGQVATVREICSRAECSVAAINYYFGDKQRLYARCVQTACERKQQLFPLPKINAASNAAHSDNSSGQDLRSRESASGPKLLREFLITMTSRMAAKSNVSWHNTLMLREIVTPSEGVAELLQERLKDDFQHLLTLVGLLLGPELDTLDRRQDFVTQIIARCMFLRTGKNLRMMLGFDSEQNEDPVRYAETVCDSILNQLDALRATQKMPPLMWTSSNNVAATESSLES